MVRGVAAAELLFALREATATDLVLALVREGATTPLLAELPAEVLCVRAAPEARWPGKRPRARERAQLWDAWLGDAEERTIDLARIQLIGTPPPLDVRKAWPGWRITSSYHEDSTGFCERFPRPTIKGLRPDELAMTCTI